MASKPIIGPRILAEIKALLCAHIDDNAEKINQAFIDEDETLSIGMPIKLGKDPNRPNHVAYSVGINFVADRVKYSNGGSMCENQRPLSEAGQGGSCAPKT